jgi:hypothetical protein
VDSSDSPRPKWVIVELSSNGEHGMDPAILIRAARRILGRPNIDVFVPAVSSKIRSDSQILIYMEGYIFIRYEDGVHYLKLRDTNYFREVLCNPGTSKGGPVYSLIDDDKLNPMRDGLEAIGNTPFEVDDRVKIIRGENKNLPGYVVDILEDGRVVVSARLLSKPLIAPYPASYLEKIIIKK